MEVTFKYVNVTALLPRRFYTDLIKFGPSEFVNEEGYSCRVEFRSNHMAEWRRKQNRKVNKERNRWRTHQVAKSSSSKTAVHLRIRIACWTYHMNAKVELARTGSLVMVMITQYFSTHLMAESSPTAHLHHPSISQISLGIGLFKFSK